MLDPKIYREEPQKVKDGLARRHTSFDLEAFLALDTEKRDLGAELDALKAERNTATESIAQMKRTGGDAEAAILKSREIGDAIKARQDRFNELEQRLRDEALQIPNLPHESVPDGRSSADNVVAASWGTPTQAQHGLDHLAIGKALKLFDFERGAKISGSGFPVLLGNGARLERALISYFLDQHVSNGYTEILPPLLVNRASMTGTGQLPKFADQLYHCGEDDLFLIPTAEVPVTNLHSGEILEVSALPLRYCAYTPCFRREAGAWGADTRGFLRLHQFNKVEMVQFTLPENSYSSLETLRGSAEALLQKLELPYRVLSLCAGDLGFGAAKCYDLEVWAAQEGKWLEVSSCSNFEDFQARRAQIRTKVQGKTRLVHTLNGSGLATPRVLVALLETHYQTDGTLRLPAALRPYFGGAIGIGPEGLIQG
jgi:seryl-tRNA synthetase